MPQCRIAYPRFLGDGLMGGQANNRSQGKRMRQEAHGDTFNGQLLDFVSLAGRSFHIRISLCHYVCNPLCITFELLKGPTREALLSAKLV
jgi:hypothetical protein